MSDYSSKLKCWLKDNYRGIPCRIELWDANIMVADSLSGPNYQQEKNAADDILPEPYRIGEGIHEYYRRCCEHYYGNGIVDPGENIFHTEYMISVGTVVWATMHHMGTERFTDVYSYKSCFDAPKTVKDIFNTYITPLIIAIYLNGDINNDDIFWTDSEIPTIHVGHGIQHLIDVWNGIIQGDFRMSFSPYELGLHISHTVFSINQERQEYLKEVMEKALQ